MPFPTATPLSPSPTGLEGLSPDLVAALKAQGGKPIQWNNFPRFAKSAEGYQNQGTGLPAAAETGGTDILGALSSLAKVAGPLYAGYQMGKPMADSLQGQEDQWAGQANGQVPFTNADDPRIASDTKLPGMGGQAGGPDGSPSLFQQMSGQRPTGTPSMALAALTGQPAGATSQPSPDVSHTPTSVTDTQGAGSQSTNDGGVGPVPAASAQGQVDPGNLGGGSPATGAAAPSQSSADPQTSGQPQGGVTLSQIVDMIAQSTKPGNQWQPSPVAPPANAASSLAQVLKPNASAIDTSKPISRFQRLIDSWSGAYDPNRADVMRATDVRDTQALNDKERLQGNVSGQAMMDTNAANTQLQKEASSAGGVSPQMKMIMDIMGGSLTAGQQMRAKLAEIGAETEGKVAVEHAKPENRALDPDVMSRQTLAKSVEKDPDLYTPQRLANILGIKNPTQDDYSQIAATTAAITKARGFDPQHIMEANLLQSVLDKINAQKAMFAKGQPTGGTAPGGNGRPSNLNLTALAH